ncbi:MAG: hypothetical protein HDS09_00765 [Bacteroides sp.]|nr:hypothetical protein [Bacteroides sp.]
MTDYTHLPICNDALKVKRGKVSDLRQSMLESDIRALELQGFIKNAISNDGLTWSLTKRGEEVRDYFLSKRSRFAKVADWTLRNIFRMNIVI